jgi:hypothetical protein
LHSSRENAARHASVQDSAARHLSILGDLEIFVFCRPSSGAVEGGIAIESGRHYCSSKGFLTHSSCQKSRQGYADYFAQIQLGVLPVVNTT